MILDYMLKEHISRGIYFVEVDQRFYTQPQKILDFQLKAETVINILNFSLFVCSVMIKLGLIFFCVTASSIERNLGTILDKTVYMDLIVEQWNKIQCTNSFTTMYVSKRSFDTFIKFYNWKIMTLSFMLFVFSIIFYRSHLCKIVVNNAMFD